MKTANHKEFIHFVQEQNEVREVHRVSGEGCYHLKIKVKSQEQLNLLLNDLLKYGNYSIHLSIQEIKQRRLLSNPCNLARQSGSNLMYNRREAEIGTSLNDP